MKLFRQRILTALQRILFTGSSLEAQLYPPLEKSVRFRPYTPSDHDACLEIYQKNEGGRFPETHRPRFEEYLRREAKTYLVAECHARVVACGGISVSGPNAAGLCYGLVDPEYQGQRIGTTLTLLRIAQLPRQPGGVFVGIFAVHASMPFFRRFGFVNYGTWKEAGSEEYPVGVLHVPDQSLHYIRFILDRRGVRVEGELTLQSSSDANCTVEEVAPGRFRYVIGGPVIEQRGNDTTKPGGGA